MQGFGEVKEGCEFPNVLGGSEASLKPASNGPIIPESDGVEPGMEFFLSEPAIDSSQNVRGPLFAKGRDSQPRSPNAAPVAKAEN